MLVVGHIRSDHEFDQLPTLHYTTLCPVVSVVVGVHNQLENIIQKFQYMECTDVVRKHH